MAKPAKMYRNKYSVDIMIAMDVALRELTKELNVDQITVA